MSRRTVRVVTPSRAASSSPRQFGRAVSNGSSRSSRPAVSVTRPSCRAFADRICPDCCLGWDWGESRAELGRKQSGHMTDIDWTFQLAEQLDWHWRAQLRPRLNGLTDEEYRWEPVPGAWNVRPRGTGTAPVQVGAGEFTIDFAMPEPDPVPVTT